MFQDETDLMVRCFIESDDEPVKVSSRQRAESFAVRIAGIIRGVSSRANFGASTHLEIDASSVVMRAATIIVREVCLRQAARLMFNALRRQPLV